MSRPIDHGGGMQANCKAWEAAQGHSGRLLLGWQGRLGPSAAVFMRKGQPRTAAGIWAEAVQDTSESEAMFGLLAGFPRHQHQQQGRFPN